MSNVEIKDMKISYKDKDGNELEILNYTGEDLKTLLKYLISDRGIYINSKDVNIDGEYAKDDDEKTMLLNNQDSIKDRLPNAYNKNGDIEVELTNGYNRFACPNCLQGIILLNEYFYIVSVHNELYKIPFNELDINDFCNRIHSMTIKEDKYLLLNDLRKDLVALCEKSSYEKVQIVKDEETFCRCPICLKIYSMKCYIDKYAKLEEENNVCNICGVGDVTYIIDKNGDNKIECDSCSY